mgnify:CR=1 FL=1
MTAKQENPAMLPLTHRLTLTYASSMLLAALLAAASIAGLVFQSGIYPTDALLESFLPNDVANLLIGLPVLLGSMWLARKGSLSGLLLWIGAILFVLYGYLVYLFAMPLNFQFVVYPALVLLSACSLAGLITTIDGQLVRHRLVGVVPERLAGGVLGGLGLLFFVQAAFALVSKTPILRTELSLHITDCLISPAWVIGGVMLWRQKEFGYIVGLGLLFQASMLFVGLIIVLLLQPLLINAPFAPVDVLVVFVMGLICFIPLGLFLRGVVRSRNSSSTA